MKVTDVSCDPDTVPASVVCVLPVFTFSTMGPVTLAPLCVAVHDVTGIGVERSG
ncbi:MAG: hypothetical protein K2Y23_13460 [Cyanobacteria bacterium]|nr:hypothetical protein [Cyanobacteriota bacterium]